MAPAGKTLVEYISPQPGKWVELQKGLRAFTGPGYILAAATRPWVTVNSGIFGGGIGRKRYFLNRQVDKMYSSDCPADEMAAYLASQFESYSSASGVDWAALMTAARVNDACWVKVSHQDYLAHLIITAGVNNACSAGVTPYCVPAPNITKPGTINIMAFLSHSLTPGALVNAVQTVTEAKTQTLRDLDVTCPVTGAFASGTNTDATLIASADSIPCEYAGPGTLIGYMLARGVRAALTRAVKAYLEAGSY
ncbi:adenosylcobinamide amidohydrolase [Pelotomaculum propionicicum]|uniref:adenosylcobinamide amidohydrolase n=1 Tax=Pelotomaculum propionicicum TaxID=258475 RepID=UPI003B8200BE